MIPAINLQIWNFYNFLPSLPLETRRSSKGPSLAPLLARSSARRSRAFADWSTSGVLSWWGKDVGNAAVFHWLMIIFPWFSMDFHSFPCFENNRCHGPEVICRRIIWHELTPYHGRWGTAQPGFLPISGKFHRPKLSNTGNWISDGEWICQIIGDPPIFLGTHVPTNYRVYRTWHLGMGHTKDFWY